MDPTEEGSTIETLRYRILLHLEHTIHLLTIRDQEFLPQPFPDDPTRLPPFFPDGECVHTTHIDWIDHSHHVRRIYEVKLRHFDPEPEDRYLTWEIVIKRWSAPEPRRQMGLLEISLELYRDQTLFRFTGPFILSALRMSVQSATPIRVVRRRVLVAPQMPSTTTSPVHNQNFIPPAYAEVVQMIDVNGNIRSELARRELSS